MQSKWVGAIMIIAGCTAIGWSAAATYLQTERILEKMIWILEFMERDLAVNLTPLPELCLLAGQKAGGALGRIFHNFAHELEQNMAPDASGCMEEAIRGSSDLPAIPKKYLSNLGNSLGKYNLELQLEALQSLRANCKAEICEIKSRKDMYIRNCRTIGFCSGVALTIILV